MKTHNQIIKYACLGVAALALAAFGVGTAHADRVIYRFNASTEVSSWRYDYGLGAANQTFSYDTTEDAGGGTTPGSMKMVMNYAGAGSFAYTADTFGTATNLTLANYTNISMQVKVAPGSVAAGNGDAGYFKLVIRAGNGSYTYLQQYGANINTNNGWFTINVPITGDVTQTRAFTIETYNGTAGTRTVWIDNLILKGGASPPLVIVDPPPTCETGLVLNRFYVAGEIYNWPFDFGLTGSANLFATNNVDCGAYTNKGSLKLTLPFGTAGAGGYAFTSILPSVYTNLSALGYTNIAFDLKVDSSSPSYADYSAGYFQFVIRTGPGWDWNPLIGGNLNVTNGWRHFDLPLLAGDLTDVRAFTMQFSDSGLTNGTRTIFFDNVVLKGPAVTENPPPVPLQCVVNAFDTMSETNGWRQGAGVPGILREWSTNNVGTNLSSGSLKVTIPFDVGLYGSDNKGQVTKTLWLGGLNVTNYGFTHLAMDVKVDPASATDAFGNNGYFNAAFRTGFVDEPAGTNTSWVPQIGGNINSANGWVHYEVPITGNLTNTWELTLQDYGAPGQNITGTVIFYVDNIVLKGATCYSVAGPTVISVSRNGSNVNLSWPSTVGKVYQLQSSSNVNTGYVSDGTSTNGTGSTITLQRAISGSKFYRLNIN